MSRHKRRFGKCSRRGKSSHLCDKSAKADRDFRHHPEASENFLIHFLMEAGRSCASVTASFIPLPFHLSQSREGDDSVLVKTERERNAKPRDNKEE
jgi:hypothetical protein